MTKLAIFASGSGTNAQAIMEYFGGEGSQISVVSVLSNKADAYVLQRAESFGVETLVFSAKELREEPSKILQYLRSKGVNMIVLAGFLLLIPSEIVDAYPNRIVNIHPALLPDFGGKGMYGARVHEAVVAEARAESGITIHFVNERYDQGDIILQARVALQEGETPDSLAQKIHALEYEHFAPTIERVIAELPAE